MARATKALQNAVSEYCRNLRSKLDLRPADYNFDPWKTVQILDGAKFFCKDEETAYALYGFGDEISPECARELGACRLKRVWNEYLAGVWFECKAKENDIWKHMNGEKAAPPEIYANCYKLIPVKRELFRTIDINEDGMFEIELTPHTVGHFDPPPSERRTPHGPRRIQDPRGEIHPRRGVCMRRRIVSLLYGGQLSDPQRRDREVARPQGRRGRIFGDPPRHDVPKK